MQSKVGDGFLSRVIKGALFSVIFCLAGVLILALITKFCSLNDVAIKVINQFVKVLSIFLGAMLFVSGTGGLIKGVLIGAVGSSVTYLLFSLLFGSPSFGVAFFIDVVFCAIVGGISGVISMNIKSK